MIATPRFLFFFAGVIFTVFPRSLFIIEGRSDDVCVAVEQGRIEATQSIEITVTTQDMSAAGT